MRVPFELQWGLGTLASKIDCGVVSALDVVEAIKSAMPAKWLAAHSMATDSVSIVFSMAAHDIVEVYRSALNAWGAADVIETSIRPVASDQTAASSSASRPPPAPAAAIASCSVAAGSDAASDHGESLLQLVRMLTAELEHCATTLVQTNDIFQAAQTVLSVKDLSPLQSTLVSSMFKAASSRGSDVQAWSALARQLPHVLDYSCRQLLFRKLTQTAPEQLLTLRQDRVNNVDRGRLLEWAAAIAAATRGKRNPLMVQFAHEAGFGEAITASFFTEVADAFAFADLGMWHVHGDDAPEEFSSDEAHRPLLASNGLFPQPYCASLPMPPTLIHNFMLLGCIMGKALHDGRAFPLRISYAVARCICGHDLTFDDLGAFLSPQRFECLKRLRAFVAGGCAFPADAVDYFGDFHVYCHVGDAANGRLVMRGLELVPDGSKVDLSEANAAMFLKAFERMFLGDGVALQMRALRDGFYSIVPRDAVAILGASGLLRELCCLEVAPFDEEDVRFGLLPVNGYDADSPQFQWLIKSMLRFNQHERATFLRWVRGGPSLPSGFTGLPKRISVQGVHAHQQQSYFPLCSRTRFSSYYRFRRQGRWQLLAQSADLPGHDQAAAVRLHVWFCRV